MHRLTPAYQPPTSTQRFAAIAGAIEAWEHTGQPGPAIIANTLAWADGYTQIAPNPEDLFPHVPAMNAYDDMHPAEYSDQPDRQSSMKAADLAEENPANPAEPEANAGDVVDDVVTDEDSKPQPLLNKVFGRADKPQQPSQPGALHPDNPPGPDDPRKP